MISKSSIFQKSYHAPVSSAEIASAIQAAKEASGNVAAAQRRVQEAKNEVLQQQHLASQKQSDAALALQVSKAQSLRNFTFDSSINFQKAEAAAAVQQQEAKSAAQSVVRAQQRLAQAKAEVSEAQKMAAQKEAYAAAIIQKSASAASHEIQKTG